jgi:hypothetical protein
LTSRLPLRFPVSVRWGSYDSVEMDTRKNELAMAIDLRLADLWAEIFEVDPAKIDPELLGWFLRAAYGQGYTDALRESKRGQLCLDLGYRVPDPAA